MTEQLQGMPPASQSQLAPSPVKDNIASKSLFAELTQLFSNPATGEPYKHSVETTVTLLKVTAVLLLRLGVTLFAMAIWLWGLGFQLGYYFRKWIEETEDLSVDKVVCKVLWVVTRPFVRLHQWATSFLGWNDPLQELKQGSMPSLPSGEEKPAAALMTLDAKSVSNS